MEYCDHCKGNGMYFSKEILRDEMYCIYGFWSCYICGNKAYTSVYKSVDRVKLSSQEIWAHKCADKLLTAMVKKEDKDQLKQFMLDKSKNYVWTNPFVICFWVMIIAPLIGG